MMNESCERVYGLRERIPVKREVNPSSHLLKNVIFKHAEVILEGINAIYVGSKHEGCRCEECGGESKECRVSYWVYVNATPHVQTVIEKILEGHNEWGEITNNDVDCTKSVIKCIKGEKDHRDGIYFTEYDCFERQ